MIFVTTKDLCFITMLNRQENYSFQCLNRYPAQVNKMRTTSIDFVTFVSNHYSVIQECLVNLFLAPEHYVIYLKEVMVILWVIHVTK